MKIFLVTNQTWYSRLHRWFEEVEVTHIGLGFDIGGVGLVVDASNNGSKIYREDLWLDKYTTVIQVEIGRHETSEINMFKRVANYSVGKKYDWGAYAYGWKSAVEKKVFNTPYPSTNPWGCDGRLWCTEILNPILDDLKFFKIDLTKHDLAATTPHMILGIASENRETTRIS